MNNPIPMLDLYRQYLSIKKDVDTAIDEVIKNSAFIGGKYVENLENAISSYCGTKYAVSVNSGTDALHLALWSIGVGNNDEVITTPFTFIATAEVISLRGAKPIFVDINPKTFNINEDMIEKKITKKTKVIIPVHLFGQMAEMDKIRKIANKYKIAVIEDACQAIGAKYKNEKTGNAGKIGCFSFYPTKNLGGYGDGGIIVTNNKFLAGKIRILRNHGCVVKYNNKTIGVSSRLDGIQANILLAKLKYLDEWNKKRRIIAQEYNKRLKNLDYVQIPIQNNSAFHVYNQYTIRVKNKRDELKKYLASKNISTMIYYPKPLHLLKAMKYLNYKRGDLPNAEKASREVLSLPIYPELTEKEVDYIANTIKRFKWS